MKVFLLLNDKGQLLLKTTDAIEGLEKYPAGLHRNIQLHSKGLGHRAGQASDCFEPDDSLPSAHNTDQHTIVAKITIHNYEELRRYKVALMQQEGVMVSKDKTTWTGITLDVFNAIAQGHIVVAPVAAAGSWVPPSKEEVQLKCASEKILSDVVHMQSVVRAAYQKVTLSKDLLPSIQDRMVRGDKQFVSTLSCLIKNIDREILLPTGQALEFVHHNVGLVNEGVFNDHATQEFSALVDEITRVLSQAKGLKAAYQALEEQAKPRTTVELSGQRNFFFEASTQRSLLVAAAEQLDREEEKKRADEFAKKQLASGVALQDDLLGRDPDGPGAGSCAEKPGASLMSVLRSGLSFFSAKVASPEPQGARYSEPKVPNVGADESGGLEMTDLGKLNGSRAHHN